ncbi:LCP family protein [Propioniciclava soli]|uniref:LCP family protein n=1 Tax=Propioniciclava soli TaxID=2775081 RepID=A0ABZ3C7P7_9ACTN
MTRNDDEDWLYRRGRYADGDAEATRRRDDGGRDRAPSQRASFDGGRNPTAQDPYAQDPFAQDPYGLNSDSPPVRAPRPYAPNAYEQEVDAPAVLGDGRGRAPQAGRSGDTRYGTPTPVAHHGSRGTAGPAGRPTGAGGRPPGIPGRPPGPPQGSRPMATGGSMTAAASRGRVRRGSRRRVGVTIVAVVLAYLLGIPLVTWPFMPRVDATPEGERPASQPGQVFVLAGSDSRAGLSEEEQNRLGTGNDAGQRTDTIMMLYLPRDGRAALISVPRDSFVTIPGHGKNKINAAYSLGGPELLVATIEQSTGVQVDGYAEIGFGGFVNAVDAVGGIEMCPAEAINDRDSNLDIPAGCQQMDGVTALGYVRMRKADPRGDLGRAERQREMLGALAKKTVSPATVLLPWRWWGVNRALSQSVTVGRDTGIGQLAGLGTAAVRIAGGDGVQLSVPVGNANAHTSAGSSVLWDEARAKEMFAAMQAGQSVESFA